MNEQKGFSPENIEGGKEHEPTIARISRGMQESAF